LSSTARPEVLLSHPDQNPTDEEVRAWQPNIVVRAILFADDHKLLPASWLHGLLFTRASILLRRTFLCGQYSITGWWYYFPLAMLFKTPLATLAVLLAT